ncbi:MAG TPA: AtpZ/AtpI family protein [Actinomycetota bacterium]|nr:AtpZ/AtpI family protein [Actinomycetota bacterium]
MGNRADLGRGLSLAFEFAGAVALFWFLGRLVDNWLGTDPLAQIVGSVFGWVGGFLHVYYATLPASAKEAARAKKAARATTGTSGDPERQADADG